MAECCSHELPDSPRPSPLPAGSWGCPMCPGVVASAPGACPECGMALESADPLVEDDGERRSMLLRSAASILLGLPVLLLAMGEMWPPIAERLAPIAGWSLPIQALLTTAVLFGAGWPLLQRGVDSIRNRQPNMFTLVAMGTSVAYLYSVSAWLLAARIPAAFTDGAGRPFVYFEAAVVIVALVLLGQYLELRARRRTRDALRGLAELAPSRVLRITAHGDERIALDQLRVGDRLRVRAGDRVPVDGEVVAGSAAIDESMLSGESVPRTVQSGESVTGGTLNRSGSIEMRVTAVGGDTVLARIMALVAAAQKSKAPVQKLADRAAEKFVPAVFIVAIVSFVCWLIWGPEPSIAHAVLNAVAVLIIACPCALGLATPVSIAIALGRGAKSGLLIRDAASLQRLAEVERILVDKTGTLTAGSPRLVEAVPLTHRGVGADDLLSLGAALERGSDHPFADAVCRAADERGLTPLRVDQFESIIGRGVRGVVRGRKVALGSRSFMRELDVDLEPLDATAIDHESRGRNVLFVALDGALSGCMVIEDPIRPDAFEAIAELRAAGCRITMLSGDEARVARAVARELEITSIRAGASPEDKQRYLRSMQAQGSVVAMVGDGVNDAAALATADVGIAMGGGSEVALDAASITLLRNDLRALVRARRLAEETMRNVKQNLWFAFLYNGIGIPIAAGLLVPLIGLRLNPMIAAAAMCLSSLSVLLNALRLRGAAPKLKIAV